jgi:hypothetical protein
LNVFLIVIARIILGFVSCFSEVGNDLSQWRAYGGGENGFAIGFDPRMLAYTAAVNHHSPLVPVLYDRNKQQALGRKVATATIRFFLDGLKKDRAATRELWAREFLDEWGKAITFFGPMLKNEAFKDEREWRIVHQLNDSDYTNLRFFQKTTMMTRHLPLTYPDPNIPVPSGAPPHLPMVAILVGPSRNAEISRISVGTLLHKCWYPVNRPEVSLSKIPYQTP